MAAVTEKTPETKERPDAQPDFWPWTSLLESKDDRLKILLEAIKSRASADEPLIEHVRFMTCAQMATIGLLIEMLEGRDRPRPKSEDA